MYFHFRHLPQALHTKQTKTVLIIRNPKDTAVSHHNHCKGIKIYDYDGEWKHFLQLWTQGKGVRNILISFIFCIKLVKSRHYEALRGAVII